MAKNNKVSKSAQMQAEIAKIMVSGLSPEEQLSALNEVMAKTARAPMSQEAREKISNALKGRPGKPMSEESKAKIAAHWTPEKRQEMSEKLTGRHLTEKQCAKLSNSLRETNERKAAEKNALLARIAELEAAVAGQAERKTSRKS